MKRQMTPRERILAAIDHKPVDMVPLDYWGTAEATSKLMKGLGAKDEMELWGILDLDKILWAGPDYIGPEAKQTDDVISDYWGIKSKPITYGDNLGVYYEMVLHPLEKYETIAEIEANYTWPDVSWFDFSKVAEKCRKYPDHAIEAGCMPPFFIFTCIRGLEQSLVDLAADEEIVYYIVDKICSFLYDYHVKLFDAAQGRIDITQVTDDFGTQTGLMISLDMFDKYFKSYYQKFIKLAKSYGIRVFHHDDGSIMPIIPKLVDVGIDILNPIQWHLPGMDLKELKQRFGQKLCFHGGIDNQHVLPFGSTDEVKEEVRTCIDVLASDGTGYILAPCHCVQANTSVKNIVTMYKTAREYCRFK